MLVRMCIHGLVLLCPIRYAGGEREGCSQRHRRSPDELGALPFAAGCQAASRRTRQSCRTTLNSELLILRGMSPLYSMKPSFLNLFRKKFTRERVVPTISARVSCEILGTTRAGLSCFP